VCVCHGTESKQINDTQSARERQFAEDLAAKLALEKQFDADLRRLFNEINRDYRAQLRASGRVIRAIDFQPEMLGVLRRHYRRTFRRFGGQLRREIETLISIELSILSESREFIRRETQQRSQIIINTTQSQLDDGALAARRQFSEDNPFQSTSDDAARSKISKDASKSFREKIPGKAAAIASTEVQNAAEAAKLIEALAVSDSRIVENVQKEWFSVLIQTTRTWHAEAHGQLRAVNDLFIVRGEFLARPGDTSHGATVSNVVNCLCSAIYFAA